MYSSLLVWDSYVRFLISTGWYDMSINYWFAIDLHIYHVFVWKQFIYQMISIDGISYNFVSIVLCDLYVIHFFVFVKFTNSCNFLGFSKIPNFSFFYKLYSIDVDWSMYDQISISIHYLSEVYLIIHYFNVIYLLIYQNF